MNYLAHATNLDRVSAEEIKEKLSEEINDDKIKQTISKAVTDTGNKIIFSEKKEKAGVNNLLEIYEAFTQKQRDEIEKIFVLKNYSYLKKVVTEGVIENIKRIRQEYFRIMNEPDTLNFLLNQGALVANEISDEKMKEVKNKIGLLISKKLT